MFMDDRNLVQIHSNSDYIWTTGMTMIEGKNPTTVLGLDSRITTIISMTEKSGPLFRDLKYLGKILL